MGFWELIENECEIDNEYFQNAIDKNVAKLKDTNKSGMHEVGKNEGVVTENENHDLIMNFSVEQWFWSFMRLDSNIIEGKHEVENY